MHYLLYFPGASGLSNEPLDRCGLADLARDAAPTWFESTSAGPDVVDGGSGRGRYCTWLKGDGNDPPLQLTPSLDWSPCRPASIPGGATLEKGAYWIGRDRNSPPQAAHLERSKLYAGYWVELGDGGRWHAPSTSFLPHCHGLGDDGQYRRSVSPSYRAFWDKSQAFAQIIFQTLAELNIAQARRGSQAPQVLSADFDLADAFGFAVEALAFNYRVNAELVTQLGLFASDAALTAVIKAAIDLPALLDVRAQKKNTPSVSIPVG